MLIGELNDDVFNEWCYVCLESVHRYLANLQYFLRDMLKKLDNYF